MSEDDNNKPGEAYKNIILFPENKMVRQPKETDPKATKKMRDYQAAKFVEAATDEIGLDLVRRFVQMGLDTKQDVFTKDLALSMDAIRGLLYRQFNMKHPIQKVVDDAVKLRMNKTGVVTARIEYANMTDETSATTKPLNKPVSDDLNDRNNGFFQFTEDFEFRPDFETPEGDVSFDFNPDKDGDDGPPSDTEK